jgi:hypothetical protein
MSSLQQLRHTYSAAAGQPARAWLDKSCELLRTSTEPAEKLSLFSAMARRKAGLTSLGPAVSALPTSAGPLSINEWTCGDAARVILILTAAEAFPDHASRLIDTVYRLGDESERAIVTKSLVLYSDPDTLKHIATETGRVNSVLLFSALALDNPYPAAYFTDHEFNQMVLKSLFVGIGLERVSGLQARATAELSRMCEDYIDERRAANRTIPRDIWLAMNQYCSARGRQLMVDHLVHADQGHRYNALMALQAGHLIDQPVLELLQQRSELETDPDVLKLLQDIITAS